MSPIWEGILTSIYTIVALSVTDKIISPKIKGLSRFLLQLIIIVSLTTIICLILKHFIL